jgi:4-aminobutyrate aminotransferase-like enzyme
MCAGGVCCSEWNSERSAGTKTTRRALSDAVTDKALHLGLSANIVHVRTGASEGVMRIAPPLRATEAEIDLGLDLLNAVDRA